jgi:hypothetical protein
VAAQKKSPVASERDEGARGLWRWLSSRFDVRRLVFVEESGTHISMDRLRSRAPRGERAYGKVPKNRGKNLTLIASMSLYGMGESMCLEGAVGRYVQRHGGQGRVAHPLGDYVEQPHFVLLHSDLFLPSGVNLATTIMVPPNEDWCT